MGEPRRSPWDRHIGLPLRVLPGPAPRLASGDAGAGGYARIIAFFPGAKQEKLLQIFEEISCYSTKHERKDPGLKNPDPRLKTQD